MVASSGWEEHDAVDVSKASAALQGSAPVPLTCADALSF
jgi:hypothetical protein